MQAPTPRVYVVAQPPPLPVAVALPNQHLYGRAGEQPRQQLMQAQPQVQVQLQPQQNMQQGGGGGAQQVPVPDPGNPWAPRPKAAPDGIVNPWS